MTLIPIDPDCPVFREVVDILCRDLGDAGTAAGIAKELLERRAPDTLAAAQREGILEVLLGGATVLVGDALIALEAERSPPPDDLQTVVVVGELVDRPGVWVVLSDLDYAERPSFAEAQVCAREMAATLRADGFAVVLDGVGGGTA